MMPTPSLPWQATHSCATLGGGVPTVAVVGLSSGAGEIQRDVLDVLIRQRRGLLMHRAVRALAAAILLERRDQVRGVLPDQLRHAVGRVDVLIASIPWQPRQVYDSSLPRAASPAAKRRCADASTAVMSTLDRGRNDTTRAYRLRRRLMNNCPLGAKQAQKRAQSVRAEPRFYHSMIALIQRVSRGQRTGRRAHHRRRSARACWR